MRLIRFHVGKSALNIHQEKTMEKAAACIGQNTHKMQYILGSQTIFHVCTKWIEIGQ